MNVESIKRPSYVYISGSYALKRANEESMLYDFNYKSLNLEEFREGDIDIYIDLSDDLFNLLDISKWIKSIYDLGYFNKLNSNSIDFKRYRNMNEDEKKKVLKNMVYMTLTSLSCLYKRYIIKKLYEEEADIDDIENYINNDNFMCTKLISVYSDYNIDLIFITRDMESYMEKHFDLSICKNYINHENNIISVFSEHVEQNISEYNYKLFKLRNFNYSQNIKFIERIAKYNRRGVKIYMNFECFCGLNLVNCECKLRLSIENMKIALSGMINYCMSLEELDNPFKHSYSNYGKIQLKLDNDLKIVSDGYNTTAKIVMITNHFGKIVNQTVVENYSINQLLKTNTYNKIKFSKMLNVSIMKLRVLNELNIVLSAPKYMYLVIDFD